jgi:Transglycosylase SLT domain
VAGNEVEIVVTSKDKSGPGVTSAQEGVSRFRRAVKDTGGAAEESATKVGKYGEKIGALGEKSDNSERNLIGLHDVVDGTAAIMAGPGQAGIAAYIQGWADLAGGAAPLLESMKTLGIHTVKNTISSIREGVVKTALAVKTKAMAVAQWLLNTAMSANPIGLIIAALVLLVAGIVIAYKHSETFRKIVQAVWKELQVAIGWVAGLGRTIKDIFLKAIDWLLGAGRNVIHGFWNGLKAVWEGAKGVAGWLAGIPGKIIATYANAGKWLFDKGKDIVTGLWNGIKNVWTSTIAWFADLPKKILSALGIHSPPDWAISAGKHVMGGVLKGLLHGSGDLLGFAKGLPGKLGHLMGNIFGTPSSVTGGAVGDWIKQAMQILGLPGPWFDPIMRRVMFESGGNPGAINLTDSNAAAGHPSMGLMQTIASTFGAYALPGMKDIWNPVHNLVAALRYILSRYGSIFAIDPPISGYAGGTDWVPRTGLAVLHRGEAVLTAAQNRRGGAGTVVLEIHSGGSRLDDLLVEVLRKSIRSKGGDVQVVLGT